VRLIENRGEVISNTIYPGRFDSSGSILNLYRSEKENKEKKKEKKKKENFEFALSGKEIHLPF